MSSKVGAAAVASALGVLLIYLIEAVSKVDLPTSVEGALVVLLTLGVGYLIPETNPAPSAVAAVREKGLA